MDFGAYKTFVTTLPYGKRLPTAVYVCCETGASLGSELDALLERIRIAFALDGDYNVLKFRTDEFKISFLSYPSFFMDPHPALRHATAVDLVTGKIRHTDYARNVNPPILHRKENFLPDGHPLRPRFEALTLAEEEAGLFEHTATIGFKLNWEKLLRAKGVAIADHTLVQRMEQVPKVPQTPAEVVVERHKTALTRYDLSKPIKTLLEYGVLKVETTVFDYGCGQGSDIQGLQALGYPADGWDPVFRADAGKREAEVVNFGYVLNVIEDPAERLEALVEAWRHAQRLLVVSGLITETVDVSQARLYNDGVLTKSNTFQKYFEQQELQQYIEDALDTTAVPVSLGVFYVFRNPTDQQDFLSSRSRRAINWDQISSRLGLGTPTRLWKSLYEEHKQLLDAFGQTALALGRLPGENEFAELTAINERLGSAKRAIRAFVLGGGAGDLDWPDAKVRFGIGVPAPPRWQVVFDQNKELLEAFWKAALELARLPGPEEFQRYAELREKIGSPKRALRLFVLRGGGDEIKQAAENRRRDLLVYVALANLRRKVPFGHLSQSLRLDIREFFGNYTRALKEGVELLYAAGDPGEIELACEDLKVGWQDEQALYIHRSLLNELPPVLRAYVGCATALFGDVTQADVIKLHKASGKVTFLAYDDFEEKPLPELKQRIKVNLRTRWVQVYDHSGEEQLLCCKEKMLPAAHPGRAKMESYSSKLSQLGLVCSPALVLTKQEFANMCAAKGLNSNLNRLRTKHQREG